jgi:ketosteroid isomerase-like protein
MRVLATRNILSRRFTAERDTGRTMSRENVEIVRLALQHLNDGDINGLIALCDGDFELDMTARILNPETYRGHEGIRHFYREVNEVWEEFRWEPLRFFGTADKVVVLLHSHGRGRGSGLEMARDAAMVWTVREGLAVSVRFYIDQAEALEAAGVSG